MKTKQSLRNVIIISALLGMAWPAQAWWDQKCWMIGCVWTNPSANFSRLLDLLALRKLLKTEIWASEGFAKIREALEEGEGAEGESEDDLSTEEEGVQMSGDSASTVPDIVVDLISDAEKNKEGLGFLDVREANAQILLADYCSQCASRSDDNTCTLYEKIECTDEEKITLNQGCDACSKRDDSGKCISYNSAQCALERQNYWLITAAIGAEATLDAHSGSSASFYSNLKSLLEQAKEVETIYDYWTVLQRFSVQSSKITSEVSFVYAMDLLSTAERRVSEAGTNYQEFSTTEE